MRTAVRCRLPFLGAANVYAGTFPPRPAIVPSRCRNKNLRHSEGIANLKWTALCAKHFVVISVRPRMGVLTLEQFTDDSRANAVAG